MIDQFNIHNDWILIHGRPDQDVFKIGNYNPFGWIAYRWKIVLFIKRFTDL